MQCDVSIVTQNYSLPVDMAMIDFERSPTLCLYSEFSVLFRLYSLYVVHVSIL